MKTLVRVQCSVEYSFRQVIDIHLTVIPTDLNEG